MSHFVPALAPGSDPIIQRIRKQLGGGENKMVTQLHWPFVYIVFLCINNYQ